MSAGLLDLTGDLAIERSADYALAFEYTDELSAAIDLTNAVIKFQARANATDTGTAIIDWSTTNGKISITDPTNGIFAIAASGTDTSAITSSFINGVYDLLVELSSGAKIRLVQGSVSVTPSVVK